MTTSKRTMKKAIVSAAFAVSLGALAAPGTAQAGFFDDLFGVAPRPAAPVYQYDAPSAAPSELAPMPLHRSRKTVVADDKPVLQKTTDLWHDKTLREGDAVMMKDGMHVYTGSEGSRPVARDFPRVDRAKDLSSRDRAVLLAMDTSHDDPLKRGMAPDTIASGRSAAVASPAVAGYKITDARGKSVRYVGP